MRPRDGLDASRMFEPSRKINRFFPAKLLIGEGERKGVGQAALQEARALGRR